MATAIHASLASVVKRTVMIQVNETTGRTITIDL